MDIVVNVHEAKTQLSKLLERVKQGEVFILAKAGKPYARLIPMDHQAPRKPGIAEGWIDEAFFEPLPEAELEKWES